jgi:hypothetical protein
MLFLVVMIAYAISGMSGRDSQLSMQEKSAINHSITQQAVVVSVVIVICWFGMLMTRSLGWLWVVLWLVPGVPYIFMNSKEAYTPPFPDSLIPAVLIGSQLWVALYPRSEALPDSKPEHTGSSTVWSRASWVWRSAAVLGLLTLVYTAARAFMWAYTIDMWMVTPTVTAVGLGIYCWILLIRSGYSAGFWLTVWGLVSLIFLAANLVPEAIASTIDPARALLNTIGAAIMGLQIWVAVTANRHRLITTPARTTGARMGKRRLGEGRE